MCAGGCGRVTLCTLILELSTAYAGQKRNPKPFLRSPKRESVTMGMTIYGEASPSSSSPLYSLAHRFVTSQSHTRHTHARGHSNVRDFLRPPPQCSVCCSPSRPTSHQHPLQRADSERARERERERNISSDRRERLAKQLGGAPSACTRESTSER